MCLDTLLPFNPETEKEGTGYKVYKVEHGYYHPIYYSNPDNNRLHSCCCIQNDPKKGWVIGKWYTDPNKELLTTTQLYPAISYQSGFHIFPELNDAVNFQNGNSDFKVFKVKYKNVVAKGTQMATSEQVPVIVAKDIIIEDQIT